LFGSEAFAKQSNITSLVQLELLLTGSPKFSFPSRTTGMSEESALSAILGEIHQAHISSSDDPSYKEAKVKLAQERRCLGRNSRMVKVRLSSPTVLISIIVAWQRIQIRLAMSGQPFIPKRRIRLTTLELTLLRNVSDHLRRLVRALCFTECSVLLLISISSLRIV
jgi:hypothetical protein